MGSLVIASTVALLLTLFSGSASAACAWVLWQQASINGLLEEWQAHMSFDKSDLCNSALETARGHALKNGAQEMGDVFIFKFGQTVMTKVIRCLPDTIDPRAPKAR